MHLCISVVGMITPNFQKLIIDLCSSGMTESEIAITVSTTQPTIHRIKTGAIKSPRFVLATGIMALHNQKIPVDPVAQPLSAV